jgi:hypothetical protein
MVSRRLSESPKKLLALLLGHEEGPFPSDTTVTVGRDITARLLDKCGNHGSLFGSLRRRFVLRAPLCKIVIVLSETSLL